MLGHPSTVLKAHLAVEFKGSEYQDRGSECRSDMLVVGLLNTHQMAFIPR